MVSVAWKVSHKDKSDCAFVVCYCLNVCSFDVMNKTHLVVIKLQVAYTYGVRQKSGKDAYRLARFGGEATQWVSWKLESWGGYVHFPSSFVSCRDYLQFKRLVQ